MRYAISYVSTASNYVTEAEIDTLLKDCVTSNKENNIAGILLYSDGNFLQVLEGEKEKVTQLYENIQADDRHHGVLKILGREISEVLYEGYDSNFILEQPQNFDDDMDVYLDPLKDLDKSSQKLIEKMIILFLKK
jgi:hypothetical protein